MKITKAEGLKRLLRLAKFLEKLPRHRFDYGSWVGSDWEGKPDLRCGTTACALGWATTLWPRELKLTRGDVGNGFVTRARSHLRNLENCNETSFSAASTAFAIDAETALVLFSPEGARLPKEATPKQVAKHIRKYVAKVRALISLSVAVRGATTVSVWCSAPSARRTSTKTCSRWSRC